MADMLFLRDVHPWDARIPNNNSDRSNKKSARLSGHAKERPSEGRRL
jgi:hypothetical protein